MKIIPNFIKSAFYSQKPEFSGPQISAPIIKNSRINTPSDGLGDADFGEPAEFSLKAMRQGERERDRANNVVYLSADQKDQYEFRPQNGQLFRKDGVMPVDTKLFYKSRSLLYVISRDKKIYSGRGSKHILHHSSFLAGDDVVAAGKIKTSFGKVIFISNNSGHYRPSAEYLLQAVRHFHDLGVLSPDAIIDIRHVGKFGLKEGIVELNKAIAQQNLAVDGQGQGLTTVKEKLSL